MTDAVQYGLGKPMTKDFRDIINPPKEVDVQAVTNDILNKTGITLKG